MHAMAAKTYEDDEYGRAETSMDETAVETTGSATVDTNTLNQPRTRRSRGCRQRIQAAVRTRRTGGQGDASQPPCANKPLQSLIRPPDSDTHHAADLEHYEIAKIGQDSQTYHTMQHNPRK